MLKIITLGAAAGGGLPQWNCRCGGCQAVRNHPLRQHGQVSLAVSADEGAHWFILNASPDLRALINATPALWPHDGHLRHSPIAGVVLSNGEIDAVAGLLSLREGHKFSLYGHESVLATLRDNSIFNVLNPANVRREALIPDRSFEPLLPDGTPSGLEITPFEVPGKCAWYLEQEGLDPAGQEGESLGLTLRIRGQAAVVHVVLACAEITPALRERLRGADLVFFEGTLWQDDEMIRQGLSVKTGRRMGHVSISGPDGSLTQLSDLGIARKVYVHINNSNPIWCADSAERAAITEAGWHVPQPGEEFSV